MFFPRAMTEIELVVPSKDLLAVTKILSRRGVFHQADSNYPGVDTGAANTWQETAAAYAALERRLQLMMQTLGIEEGQPPSAEFEAVPEIETVRSAVDEIEAEVKRVSDQLSAEKKRLEQLQSDLRQLEPLAGVDADIGSLRGSGYLFSMLGQIPTANVDRLKTSLARVPHVFLILRSDSQKSVVWLTGSKNNADVLDRAARSAYLNPIALPTEYRGTPEKIIKNIHEAIQTTQQKISELNGELKKLAEARRERLQRLLWEVHASRVTADAIVRFGQLKHTYVIVGWVPTDDLEVLTQRLKQASKEILIQTVPISRAGHNQHVPVALFNNKWLKPFQMLVNTYARPRYGELDPTILMAFTFPLLYGAMFGDLGQGLVLFIMGLLMHNGKFLKSMKSLGLLIAYCGASAAIFGALYGSVFGFEGEHFYHTFGFEFHPLWISPLHEILKVALLAIDAGIVLLSLGFLLGIFNHIRSRDWAHLTFGHNGIVAFVLYLSFLGILGRLDLPVIPNLARALGTLPVPFTALGIVTGLGIMFSEVFRNLIEGHRPLIEGGIATYAIQAPMELFEVIISFLSNTFSYVRVGAFAVAHGGLSLAIFSLAGEEHDLGFWLTIIIGNLFIIGFEGLIVGIQTMRLHYYEFLGKFFTGGGMRFEPLTLTPSSEEG
ncbi:MAG TPA: V-type ATPase 116kDa subunit family protein [Anaerolineales bacterium]|nr:V-type ATPase 116kDa subunit family protein [Anaerolineales bacterium]